MAFLLLLAVGIGYLGDAVALVVGMGSYREQVEGAALEAGIPERAFGGLLPLAIAVVIIVTAMTAIAGAVILGLAFAVRTGSNVARILAWIAAGFSLLCGSGALCTARTPAVGGLGYVSASSSGPTGLATFEQRVPEGYSAAYQYSSLAVGLFAMTALLLVIVLLALPPANQFFRRYRPVPSSYPYPWPAGPGATGPG